MNASLTKEYMSAFNAYLEKTNAHEVMLNWFSEATKDQSFSTGLSVGSGFGDFDFNFLSRCDGLKKVDAIEPNPEFYTIMQKHISSYPYLINTHNIDFESYTSNERYDIILFSHSFYYFTDRVQILKKAYHEMLKPGGMMVIFHETPKGFNEVQTKIKLDRKSYTSEALITDLKQSGISYRSHLLNAYIDVNNPSDDFLSFFFERAPTKVEKANLLEVLTPYKGNIEQPIAVFVSKR